MCAYLNFHVVSMDCPRPFFGLNDSEGCRILGETIAIAPNKMSFELIPSSDLEQLKQDVQVLREVLVRVASDMDGLLDTDGACTFLCCSKRTLQKLRDGNEISFHQRGKMIWYKKSELLRFIEKYRIQAKK